MLVSITNRRSWRSCSVCNSGRDPFAVGNRWLGCWLPLIRYLFWHDREILPLISRATKRRPKTNRIDSMIAVASAMTLCYYEMNKIGSGSVRSVWLLVLCYVVSLFCLGTSALAAWLKNSKIVSFPHSTCFSSVFNSCRNSKLFFSSCTDGWSV